MQTHATLPNPPPALARFPNASR